MILIRRVRTALAASALALAALTVVPGVAAAQDLYNCSDFEFQEDAQEILDQDRSDPSRLDGLRSGQGDGIACESLPRRGGPAPTPVEEEPSDDGSAAEESDREEAAAPSDDGAPERAAAPVAPAAVPAAPGRAPSRDRDCPDFASQADAQAALDTVSSDPERLDADGDGIACEQHFGDDSRQIPVRPVGGVDTGGRENDA